MPGHLRPVAVVRTGSPYDATVTPRTRFAALVLAAISLLPGCTAAGSAMPAPVRSAEATPAAGARAFAGDCASAMSTADLDALVEGAGAAAASTPDASADGLTCTWIGSERSLTVTAIPLAGADADDIARLRLPECDPSTGFCGGGIEAGGLWIVVDFGGIEGYWEPIVSTALNAVARAAGSRN